VVRVRVNMIIVARIVANRSAWETMELYRFICCLCVYTEALCLKILC
jgi:hypothetical protein